MPSTNGLAVLIRTQPLLDAEWFKLIEARRELIKPHLDSITLQELGDLGCMRDESFTHILRGDIETTIGDPRFSLKTQGIFHVRTSPVQEPIPNSGYTTPSGTPFPDGKKCGWGLTRCGHWVLITIAFKGVEGYKCRGAERATSVEIVEADLPTIVARTQEKPQLMWEKLSQVIKDFANQRLSLYTDFSKISKMVEIEEQVMSLIPKKI